MGERKVEKISFMFKLANGWMLGSGVWGGCFELCKWGK